MVRRKSKQRVEGDAKAVQLVHSEQIGKRCPCYGMAASYKVTEEGKCFEDKDKKLKIATGKPIRGSSRIPVVRDKERILGLLSKIIMQTPGEVYLSSLPHSSSEA